MKKTFDCVEMKRRGAEEVQKSLAGMTMEEELAFWQSGTEALQQVHFSQQVETLPPAGTRTSARGGIAAGTGD